MAADQFEGAIFAEPSPVHLHCFKRLHEGSIYDNSLHNATHLLGSLGVVGKRRMINGDGDVRCCRLT